MNITPSNIIALISVVAALTSIMFGIYQYMKAQHWKKAEFAAKEMDRLNSDNRLRTACFMLDWSQRKIKVPDDVIAFSETILDHNWNEIEAAMVGRLTPIGKNGFTSKQAIYRDVFDHFFSYLKMLNHYVDIKLIRLEDISPVKYWVKQIFQSPLTDNKDIFCAYLKYFELFGVFDLAIKFQIIDPSKKLNDHKNDV